MVITKNYGRYEAWTRSLELYDEPCFSMNGQHMGRVTGTYLFSVSMPN